MILILKMKSKLNKSGKAKNLGQWAQSYLRCTKRKEIDTSSVGIVKKESNIGKRSILPSACRVLMSQ